MLDNILDRGVEGLEDMLDRGVTKYMGHACGRGRQYFGHWFGVFKNILDKSVGCIILSNIILRNGRDMGYRC